MPSTLQAQHLEDAVSVYGSLSPGVPSTASAYPDFSAPIQHEEATISHVTGIPDFHHGHNNGQEHSVNRQSLLAHGHLEVGISQAPGQTNLAYRANAPHLSSQQPALGSSMEDVPATAATGGFDMLPPPPGTHPTWQALHDFAQLHAAAHGYALSINTTAKNRSRIKLACVCYGAPKNTHKLTPETRVRKNRASYKTGCKMWIEGKKQEDGTWLLRVGEPLHNHPGRSADGWAVQRKRTWGVQGGRVGMGGVTAKEERERLGSVDEGGSWQNSEDQAVTAPTPTQGPSHSLESGGLVWRIVEQEMLRKRTPGQGRDRGVGRTVKILEERLPGIQIFKRDVYNIRAQIKRARKAAGQELGEGLDSGEEAEESWQGDPRGSSELSRREDGQNDEEERRSYSEIDPTLVAQCNDALKKVTREESEVIELRADVNMLQRVIAQQTKELEEKDAEIESLRAQLGLANMAFYGARGGHIQ